MRVRSNINHVIIERFKGVVSEGGRIDCNETRDVWQTQVRNKFELFACVRVKWSVEAPGTHLRAEILAVLRSGVELWCMKFKIWTRRYGI